MCNRSASSENMKVCGKGQTNVIELETPSMEVTNSSGVVPIIVSLI